MSVTKLNKITGLEPQEETLEEFHGPANSLKETVRVTVSNHDLPNFPSHRQHE